MESVVDMAISNRAIRGIKAAVKSNPAAARILLAILVETPNFVRRKTDKYGPLSLLLDRCYQMTEIFPGIEIPVEPQALSKKDKDDCEAFAEEWSSGRIGIEELETAIKKILDEPR